MFNRKGAIEALTEAKIDFKGNASNEELQKLIIENEIKLDTLEENKKASKVTLEDVYKVLDERLPSRNALLSLMPKKRDQAINALQNIIQSLEGDSNNIKIAKKKMEVAINLLKLED